MTQYLLSVYHPEGDQPPPDVLEKVMEDVDALNQGRGTLNDGWGRMPRTAPPGRSWTKRG